MAELSYAERLDAEQAAGRANRNRVITEGWNAYLHDAALARREMASLPDEIDVNHIIACRIALQSCWSHLDEIEARLPVARANVRVGIEDATRARLMGRGAPVGDKLGDDR